MSSEEIKEKLRRGISSELTPSHIRERMEEKLAKLEYEGSEQQKQDIAEAEKIIEEKNKRIQQAEIKLLEEAKRKEEEEAKRKEEEEAKPKPRVFSELEREELKDKYKHRLKRRKLIKTI